MRSDAMNKAGEAASRPTRLPRTPTGTAGLDSLRTMVSNIDDYKLQTSATVDFKFNQYKLSDDAKQDLDKTR